MCIIREMIEDVERVTGKLIENNSDAGMFEELLSIKNDATFAVFEAYDTHMIRLDEKNEFLQRISDLNIKLFEHVTRKVEHLLRKK